MAAQLVPFAKVIGVTSAGILSGLGLSYNVISMPVILKTASNESIAKQWYQLYKVGAAVAPPYAIVCAICFAFLSSQSTQRPGFFPTLSLDPTAPSALYATAAVIIPSIVPWTLTQMVPTNDRLIAKAEKTDAFSHEEARRLIRKWMGLHWVRIVLLTTGTVLGAAANVLS